MPYRFYRKYWGGAPNEGMDRPMAAPVGIMGDQPEPSTGGFLQGAYGAAMERDTQNMLWDTMRLRENYTLAAMRAEQEADQQLIKGLESGDLVLDPEVQLRIQQLRKDWLESFSSNTISAFQKKALKYEFEEETTELRRNFARQPSAEERQATLQAWRQKITADWSEETWAQYGHLVPLLHPDEKGQPMMPRGVPPSMFERQGDLSGPDKYQDAYSKVWTQLYKEYQLTTPVDPKSKEQQVPNPSRLEVEERLRDMGYRLPEPTEADLRALQAMLRTMDQSPKEYAGTEQWQQAARKMLRRHPTYDPAYDSQAAPRVQRRRSPDGKYEWDGRQWVPVGGK